MRSESKRRIRAGARRGGLKAARNKRRRRVVELQRELETAGPERAEQIDSLIAELRERGT